MEEKRIAGIKAAEYIRDGYVLGLGTGSTAYYMIKQVGELVKQGLRIQAVATSVSSAGYAKEFGIPLLEIDEVQHIDLALDGVDEIDPQFNAIKGGGGALFREKMVAARAKEVIWMMDDSKLVDAIGAFALPVEILPYGYTHIIKEMQEYGLKPVLRQRDEKTFVTDNGNYIADLHIGKPMDIDAVRKQLETITGVLQTGLFLNMCDRIVVGAKDGVRVIENPNKAR